MSQCDCDVDFLAHIFEITIKTSEITTVSPLTG